MRASAVPFGHDLYFQPPAGRSSLGIKMRLHLRAIINNCVPLAVLRALGTMAPNLFPTLKHLTMSGIDPSQAFGGSRRYWPLVSSRDHPGDFMRTIDDKPRGGAERPRLQRDGADRPAHRRSIDRRHLEHGIAQVWPAMPRPEDFPNVRRNMPHRRRAGCRCDYAFESDVAVVARLRK